MPTFIWDAQPITRSRAWLHFHFPILQVGDVKPYIRRVEPAFFKLISLPLILLVCAQTLHFVSPGMRIPSAAHSVLAVLGPNQKWSMFAPNPAETEGWIVIEGRFENGATLDLWTGRPSIQFLKLYQSVFQV